MSRKRHLLRQHDNITLTIWKQENVRSDCNWVKVRAWKHPQHLFEFTPVLRRTYGREIHSHFMRFRGASK